MTSRRAFLNTMATLSLGAGGGASVLRAAAAAPLTSGRWTAACLRRAEGPYSAAELAADFGASRPANPRISIVDQALRVTLPQGRKIEGLLGAKIPLGLQHAAALEFRVRYPRTFEAGLHGKQFGLIGGAAYTGGQGAAAAKNGDGWSIRLQFDAHQHDISNCLYVYHCNLKGDYGEPLVTEPSKIRFPRGEWTRLRLVVRMQSGPLKPDGEIEVWQNDQKRLALSRVQFVRQEAGRQVDHVVLDCFCGGAGVTPTRDNHIEFADIRWWRPPAAAESPG